MSFGDSSPVTKRSLSSSHFLLPAFLLFIVAQEQTLPKFLKRIYSCCLQFRTQLMPPPLQPARVLLESVCSSPRGECWHPPSAQRPVFQPSVFCPIHSCGSLLALVSWCLNSAFSLFWTISFCFSSWATKIWATLSEHHLRMTQTVIVGLSLFGQPLSVLLRTSNLQASDLEAWIFFAYFSAWLAQPFRPCHLWTHFALTVPPQA